MSVDNQETIERGGTQWFSLIILLLVTGIVGAFIFAGIGYLITKSIKYASPATKIISLYDVGFTNYAYRGLVFFIVLYILLYLSSSAIIPG